MADKPFQSITIPELNNTYVNIPPSTASNFDTSTAYAVNDIVFYNRKLYKFVANHVAGAWNNSHVEEITIGNEIKQIENDLSDKYEKPASGIPASDLASGVIPEVPVQDVQVDGTSVLNQGVAEIPIADNNGTLGLIKIVDGTYGVVRLVNGYLSIAPATDSQIKNSTTTGSAQYRPITPSRQTASTFYGLAKAAGDSTQSASSNAVGTYTETAQSKIHEMLDAPVTVSGTTPTITAKSGIRYICGECSTLSIMPPASGDCEVIFESGSTATVLTVPNTVKFPDWFDATSLETNRTYDMIITNGVYGVVTSWA